jgi:hypothetical protein
LFSFAKYYLLVFFLSIFLVTRAQHNQSRSSAIQTVRLAEPYLLRETGKLPAHINEASGLAFIGSGKFWTHNDDGIPVLFCVDSTGNFIESIYLNSQNKGWEDVAFDNNKNLYVGAFGNNTNDRKDLKILKISDPESQTSQVIQPEIINFNYEDQTSFPPPPAARNFDADALIALDSSLYIFTKNRTAPFSGLTKIYRLPNREGSYKAILIDSINLGGSAMMDYWVTGADISPDRSILALLGHSSVWLVSGFKGEKFSTGKIVRLELGHYSHKAGIAFVSNSQLYIVDEKEFGVLGGKIYYLDLQWIVPKLTKN